MDEIVKFERPKQKFEVRMRKGEGGQLEKAIFIDDELLDWSIDMNSYMEAIKMGQKYRRAVQEDIEKHFISSVEDFLGRHVSMDEIKESIKTGWI